MVAFTVDENAPILVEFLPAPGVRKTDLTSTEVVEKSNQAVDAAMNTIHNMARRVMAAVEALPNRPRQVEVTFGLKLNAEGRALIAKAGAEASLNVKMTWQQP